MSARKSRSSKKSADKNISADTVPGKSSPEKLTDEKRYEGYDEERSTHNSSFENDMNKRSVEYRDYQDEIRNNSSERSQ